MFTLHTGNFKNTWLPVHNWIKILISKPGEKHWKAELGWILVFPSWLMWSSFHVIKFNFPTLLKLMILKKFSLIFLWLLMFLLFLLICNWNKKLQEKMFSVNSHLTVKIYISNHICMSLQHPWQYKIIKINFRLCKWTPQSQEEYLKENLPYALVFELILWTLKGIMDYSKSCYYISKVAHRIVY